MARLARLGVCRKWISARFHISQASIKWRQFCAQIDDPQIHEFAAGRSRVGLRFLHHLSPKALTLPRRIHAQQPEIGALSPKLHVHARDQCSIVFRQQVLPGAKHFANLTGIDAVAVNEEALHFEGGVHQGGDGFCVGFGGKSCFE